VCFADTYYTAAEAMLAAASSSPPTSSTDLLSATSERGTSKKMTPIPSLGDVWVAERAYRQAVAEQSVSWATQQPTLQSMFEVAKEGECQRRLKLRKHLLVSVIQKHAAAIHHAQKLHTDALEECMRVYDKARSTSSSSKCRKPVWTPRQRIEHVASLSGSTVVWDDTEVMPPETHVVKSSSKPETFLDAGINEKSGGFDVDDFMDDSSDEEDEDDLPLLAEASDLKTPSTITDPPKLKTSRRSVSKDARDSAKEKRKKKSKRLAELPKKANRVIMLDKALPNESFFMDRLLYSGSLLESHFVQFAAVAKVDDDRTSVADHGPSADESETSASGDDAIVEQNATTAAGKTCVVIVTRDQVLHLFDVPGSESGSGSPVTTKPIVLGSPPASALQILVKRLEAANLTAAKKAEIVVTETKKDDKATPTSKLSFRRNATVAPATPLPVVEKHKPFEMDTLAASFSIALSQCSVRFLKRREHAVKVAPKSVRALAYYGKLNFASAKDQEAFVEASAPIE
jgi:hypothetical protein